MRTLCVTLELLLILSAIGPSARAEPGAMSGPATPPVSTIRAPVGLATPDSGRARVFRWFYQDIAALAKSVATPKFALYSAGTMAGTLGLAWLDDDARTGMQHIYEGTFKDALDVVDYLGGPKINLPVVILAGTSLLTNSITFQDAAFTSLQTLVYAGLLGYGLKAVFGRERPEGQDEIDPYAFFSTTGMNPFSHEGNSSFPSGHSIAAFGIITPWVLYYPGVFTYALYVLPLGTGLSRIALSKHWATDIVVGGMIGIAMGRYLTRRHRSAQRADGPFEFSVLEEGKLFRLRLHVR